MADPYLSSKPWFLEEPGGSQDPSPGELLKSTEAKVTRHPLPHPYLRILGQG